MAHHHSRIAYPYFPNSGPRDTHYIKSLHNHAGVNVGYKIGIMNKIKSFINSN